MTIKTLILAEKPSQAKAYADAFKIQDKEKTHINLKPCTTFPEGATITWGIGHLAELYMPKEYKKEWATWKLENLPIIPQNFKFKVKDNTRSHFESVKKLFKECESSNGILINAADIDREGSNIFYSILDLTGVKNVQIKRLWINSLETDEIKKGFNNLLDNEKDLLMYEEAQTRQIADWLVGINASQLYTLLLQKQGLKKQTLSVGRVQSPTVYMIYERQKEIENFVPEPFYELVSSFSHENGRYEGKAKIKEKDWVVINELLEERNLAEMKTDEAFIKDISKKNKNKKPPKLHSLSTLQTKANKNWKYSPSKVLEIMQSLYEKKIVSYPRTDCNYITESEFQYLINNIEVYQSLINVSFNPNKEPNKRYVDSSKVQEHYAIIPTKKSPSESTINSLTQEERNVYHEILRTTLSMFHQDYQYEETIITTDVKNIEFFTKGKIETNKGWKELFHYEEKGDNDEKRRNKTLPNVEKDQSVFAELDIKEGETTPPKPFSEGALINLMKTAGQLVDDEEDSDMLKNVEGIGTEATRSGIIETIKRNKYIEVKKNIVYATPKAELLCESIEGSLLASPSMTAKWETYLDKIGKGTGKQTVFLQNVEKFLNATMNEAGKQVETLKDKIDKENEQYKVTSCPSCHDSIEDKGKFYGCNGYKNGCKVSFPKKIAEKSITKSMVKSLCEKGKTNKLKGFKSKKGNTFETQLILDQEYKIKFNFESNK